MIRRIIVFGALVLAPLPPAVAGVQAPPSVQALADAYVDLQLEADPVLADAAGLPVVHPDRLADRSPTALRALERRADDLEARMHRIDAARLNPADRATYAVLNEALAAERQARVCRSELWNVNQVAGWPAALAQVAAASDVSSPAAEEAALSRWRDLARFVDVEISNLRQGLAEGYTVPKPVVRRVVAQLDGLLKTPPENSPFVAYAAKSDPAFQAKMRAVFIGSIQPALQRYRDFLAADYLPRARDSLGLSALPQGRACYTALLRRYTTLQRTPEAVFALGEKTVAANKAGVIAEGRALYDTDDFATIVAKTAAASDNHFVSREEDLAFSEAVLARTLSKSGAAFCQLPRQAIVIAPMPDYLALAGAPAHYDPEPDATKPAHYALPLATWKSQTKGEAEITVFHETVPGHHLQVALARELHPASRLALIADNAAYIEGWARYMEGFSEELGLYESPYAKITRRVWPARGMVLDPGLHVMGWSRAKALVYLKETGRFDDAQAEALIDRVAALPGQLTAYDSGALTFLALRQKAQARLGQGFDIRAFHQTVLEEGVVPLSELEQHVAAWLRRPDAGRPGDH